MIQDFAKWNIMQWQKALRLSFPNQVPDSASWSGIAAMVNILTPFCGANINHTMIPTGGGTDVIKITPNKEEGLLDLWDSPRSALVCKPASLRFEYFAGSEWNAFFLLETRPIAPTGVYDKLLQPCEELLELPSGKFMDRSYLDQGMIGHDEAGREIPLPQNYRRITRFFSGKFLMVAKQSIWNQADATYDGRHARMTAGEIRAQIALAIMKRP